MGYRELEYGIPHMDNEKNRHIKEAYSDLIGLCAFIFKKNTPLTKLWLEKTHSLLDAKFDLLALNPGQHPLDQHGIELPNGTKSSYPLRWAELLGEIFHPIIYQYREFLVQDQIEPIFLNYR